MKNKRSLSVVLILVLLMCLFTACEVSGNKWVITKEVKEYSDEYDTPTIAYQKTFEYDATGRMVSEKEIDYDFDIWYSSYDFEYNDDGQVVAKTVESDDETFPENNISYYEYECNSYGNLSQKLFYEGIENSNEAKVPLTIENRSYKLDYIITYTYEKLQDVAV